MNIAAKILTGTSGYLGRPLRLRDLGFLMDLKLRKFIFFSSSTESYLHKIVTTSPNYGRF